MSDTVAVIGLCVGIALIVLIMLFWLFEKPLRRLYIRWSNRRFYKKTGNKVK